MHELLITSKNKTISFPEDVAELTPEQYLYYLEIVLQNMVGEISDPQIIKQRLFAKFTDVKLSWKLQFRKQEIQEAVWSALTDKINLLDSFFDITENEQGNEVYCMHLKCTANLLPKWEKYVGPDNLLMDISWGTFKQCLNALKMLQIANDEQNIQDIERYTKDIFFALYHVEQGATNKDKRIKNKRLTIPDTIQFHALTYFSYWYELITNYPITINGEDIDFAILWREDPNTEKDAPRNELDKSGWLGITFAIAESGVFGELEDVDNQKLYKVLMYLYKQKTESIFEHKKLKTQQPNDQSE